MTGRNLVYICVFCNQKFIKFVDLFLESVNTYGNIGRDSDTDIVILTHPDFSSSISDVISKSNVHIKIYEMDLNTIIEAKYSRLLIFDTPFINKYQKILYLDTDILVVNSLSKIFSNDLDEKLYVVRECDIGSSYFGGNLFDFTKIDPKTPAFNSGVLLFKNCQVIKDLFKTILDDIIDYYIIGKRTAGCIDQPFFNYHTITKSLQEMNLLKGLSINNPQSYKDHVNLVICHFAGNYANFEQKYNTIKIFLENFKTQFKN
jgi:lipopolysaccharide biosynthesis glycosyltransferase